MKLVVIVDDNEAVAASLAIAFERLGNVRPVVKYDPASALQMFSPEGDGNVAAIVTDFNLPRLNGLELIQQVRSIERYRTLPAIMITAEEDISSPDGSMVNAPNAVFKKPFSMREVCRVLEQLLS